MNKYSNGKGKGKVNEKQSKKNNTSANKFKLRKPMGISKLMFRIFANFKRKNLYKSPSFLFSSFLFIFFTIKVTQFAMYVQQVAVTIPKEEAMNNLIVVDNTQLRKMQPEVLNKYLDDLEKLKIERKRTGNIIGSNSESNSEINCEINSESNSNDKLI